MSFATASACFDLRESRFSLLAVFSIQWLLLLAGQEPSFFCDSHDAISEKVQSGGVCKSRPLSNILTVRQIQGAGNEIWSVE